MSLTPQKHPILSLRACRRPPSTMSTLNHIIEQLKTLTDLELTHVMGTALSLINKHVKKNAVPSKKGKKKITQKKSDASDSESAAASASASASGAKRGAQLVKPRAWVSYVLTHARTHGWQAFTILQSKKDKVTGLKTETPLEIPASAPEAVNGEFVFPDGKKFIHKHAMSLSKIYWSAKAKEGTHHDLYLDFEANYQPPAVASAAAASASEVSEQDDE